jgi:hypothetical protein
MNGSILYFFPAGMAEFFILTTGMAVFYILLTGMSVFAYYVQE